MTIFTVYTDGATRPTNPGPSGYGVVLYSDGEFYASEGGYIGDDLSNNQAEYAALIAGINLAHLFIKPSVTEIIIRSDSLLVINQVEGTWALRVAKLGPLHAAACRALADLRGIVPVSLEHIRGHKGEIGNEAADKLAGEAVEQHMLPNLMVMKYIEQSRGKTSIVKKGHEKLYDLMVTKFDNKVVSLASMLTAEHKADLNQLGDTTSQLLLQLSQMFAVNIGCSHLLSLSTGFRKVERDGRMIAVRTMDLTAFNSAHTLGKAGYNITVVHKPHSKDRWMTNSELGWSASNIEAPVVYAPASAVVAGETFVKDGWPPFVEINVPSGWNNAA